MNARARGKRQRDKKNPFTKVVPGVLVKPSACDARCPTCLTRCLHYPCPDAPCEGSQGGTHWFACNC